MLIKSGLTLAASGILLSAQGVNLESTTAEGYYNENQDYQGGYIAKLRQRAASATIQT